MKQVRQQTQDRLSEYRRSQVMGMNQVDLVIMLYQGSIRFLAEAIELMEQERFDHSWKKFDRARKIVIHLLGTLNRDAGDLAGKFASLYAYVIEQIGVANARRDVDIARSCIDILTTLKQGWEEMAAQATTGAIATPIDVGPVDGQTQQRAPVYVEA